jgi:hypothetical protein
MRINLGVFFFSCVKILVKSKLKNLLNSFSLNFGLCMDLSYCYFYVLI